MGSKATLLKNLQVQLDAAKLIADGKPASISKRSSWFNRHDDDGNVLLGVKVGNKIVELKKGNPFIVVGDERKLPGIIERVIGAVKAGELDDKIAARVNERRKAKVAKSS